MYMLSKAYYLAEQYDKAISGFEGIQHEYGAQRSYFPIMSTKLHYYLGLAYEKSGQHQKAAEQYDTFLNIWRNADVGDEIISDARQRLARLSS
jgi:tetratricopeptide (TPR) repeat protein